MKIDRKSMKIDRKWYKIEHLDVPTIRSCIYAWSDRGSTAKMVVFVDKFTAKRPTLIKFQPKTAHFMHKMGCFWLGWSEEMKKMENMKHI